MKSLRTAILIQVTYSILIVQSILLVLSVVDHHRQLEAHYEVTQALAYATHQEPPPYEEAVLLPLRTFTLRFLGASIFVLVVTVFLVMVGLRRLIYTPIQKIVRANEALAEQGDPERARIPEPDIPDNEFGLIIRSRARMLQAMLRSKEELTRSNQALEERVRERTRALDEALEQLRSSQTLLLQAEKMSTLGSVSASLAHDMAHPLTAIRFHARKLSTARNLAPDETAELGNILEATDQAQRIIEHFRDFARKPQTLHPVDLNQAVQRSCTLMSHQVYHDGIRLACELAPDLPPIWADEVLLQQVVVNLIANARDALLETTTAQDPAIEVHTAKDDTSVVLVVSDNGPGIATEHRDKVFDSFFTTKAPGKGTGLGLPIVKGIVERLNGTLAMDSEMGGGTTFRITLPAPEAASAEAPREATQVLMH